MVTQYGLGTPLNWSVEGGGLTSQLMTSFQNQISTYANMKAASYLLEEVDACYAGFLDKSTKNPQTLMPVLLMARSHCAYRAACMMCMSGMNIEAFALIRPTIEHAGIGLMLSNNDELAQIFLRRHQSDEALKKVKKEFHSSDISEAVYQLDKDLGAEYESLYQKCIDQGAHSNEKALTLGLCFTEGEDEVTIMSLYNNAGTLAQLDAISSTISAGLLSLRIFSSIYPERFMLLGLDREISALLADKGEVISRTFRAMERASHNK